MYEFKFTLTENDYIEFNIFHSRNSPMVKKFTRFIYIFTFAIIALALGVNLAGIEEDLILMLVVTGSVLVLLGGLLFLLKKLTFFDKAILKLQMNLMKGNGKLPFSEQNFLQFEDDCFIENTVDTETKTKYSKIERIAVSEKAIYLYLTAMTANIIPVSVFESEQQKEEFLAFINGKVAQS